MINQSFKRSLLRTSLLATIGGLSFVSAAAAQQGPAPQSDAPDVVVVTGSRIARQDYVANSPIVTVGQEELAQIGSPSVETLINQMPQFTAAVTSTSNNPGGSGQANISLRGLGTNRTLVLLDGQRLVPSNRDGTVDVNNVPAALVESVEVVTGGQSAVYGSDALAGVVNFKLKKHFEGIEVGGLYGVNDAGDGEEKSATLTMGGNFADNKGNAVVAFTYANRQPIFNAARDFSSISGASGTTPYGQFDGSGVTLAATNTLLTKYGAAANTAAQQNWGFNADGTLFTATANAKNYRGNTSSIDYATIPTLGTYNTGPLNELQVPLDRYTMFGKLSYDFNQYFHAAIDTNFVNYTSQAILAPSPGSNNPGTGTFPGTGGTGFLVPADNPFISTDLRTLLASRTDPNAPFLIRARFSNVGPRLSRSEYTVYQIGLDLGGELGLGDLTWNVYGSYGRQQRIETQTGNVSHAAVRQLLEAADGGASLCTGGYNFMNPFGVSQSCVNYISRTTKNQSEYEQRNIVADIQGSLFQLPAGAVQFDVGVDYRSDEAFFVPDSVLSVPDVSRVVDRFTPSHTLVNNAPGVVGFNAQGAVNGAIDVKEVFGEVLVPILKDVFLAKSLNLDASARYSDYSTISGVNTYKIGGDWSPIDMLKVRGGYSRAVRAPSISELFAPAANNFPAIGSPGATTAGDPCDSRSTFYRGANAAQVQALCIAQGVPASAYATYQFPNLQGQAIVGGNPNLSEETADTYTIGFVLEPKFDIPFLRNISLSVDHYDIKIENFISAPDEPTFLKRCFNAQGDNPTYSNSSLFCAPVNRDPTSGQLTGFLAVNQNLAKVQTTGTDFQFDWRVGLDEFGLSSALGSLTLNVQGTHLDSFEVAALPGDAAIDFAGTIGNTFVSSTEVAHPDWKWTSNLLYNVGKFQVGFRWRDIAEMTGTGGLAGQTAKKKDYYDLTARYDLTDNLELRASVLNLTNVAPAYLPPGIQANTDPGTYDVAGRRYTVSVTAKY